VNSTTQKLKLVLRREKMSKDEIITELVELVLMQEKEIDKLRRKITQIKQYIEVYEEYIKGE
jgi:ABC-type ATPase involved in cell division